MDGILFLGDENVLNMRVIASANSEICFEVLFGFHPVVNLKRQHNL
jgi:hypothetical protein